jgi:hypothetical protein
VNQDDPDYARGLRAPFPIPGRSGWANVQQIRRKVLELDKLLRALLMDSPAKTFLLGNLDSLGAHAEMLLLRFDRNGPPVDQSELNDMEATIRLAAKYPESFKAFDLDGLKKNAAALRKKS